MWWVLQIVLQIESKHLLLMMDDLITTAYNFNVNLHSMMKTGCSISMKLK